MFIAADIMALRCKGESCDFLNFPLDLYKDLLPVILQMSRDDITSALRTFSKQRTTLRNSGGDFQSLLYKNVDGPSECGGGGGGRVGATAGEKQAPCCISHTACLVPGFSVTEAERSRLVSRSIAMQKYYHYYNDDDGDDDEEDGEGGSYSESEEESLVDKAPTTKRAIAMKLRRARPSDRLSFHASQALNPTSMNDNYPGHRLHALRTRSLDLASPFLHSMHSTPAYHVPPFFRASDSASDEASTPLADHVNRAMLIDRSTEFDGHVYAALSHGHGFASFAPWSCRRNACDDVAERDDSGDDLVMSCLFSGVSDDAVRSLYVVVVIQFFYLITATLLHILLLYEAFTSPTTKQCFFI